MDLLEGLNPQQHQAVTAAPGPVLVLAGPGSGKTRVLTHRLAYRIREQGVPPRSIMAVTFTNKAAREMSSRVAALLGGADGGVSLGTFHALCARMLRREAEQIGLSRDFVIYDEADQLSLVRQVLKGLNLDPKQVQPGKVLAAISSAKNELIGPQDLSPADYFAEITRRVYERYQVLLRVNQALDFDDLLLDTVQLLRRDDLLQKYRRSYPHILVDEFQDTNTAQYEILRLLAGEAPDLFVVGDPDQSIYRWRGADYRNVHRFQKDYPQAQVILLEQNYRSTQTILDAAMAVIDRQGERHRKQLFTERGRGPQVVFHEAYDEADEAQYVVETIAGLTLAGEAEPGGCAVMYRTNAQSRALEEAFLRAGLPYRLVGAQRFYGRREIKDLVAYLRLIHNPADQVGLLRVLNTPPRGLGEKTLETLLQTATQAGVAPAAVLLDLAAGGASEYGGVFSGRVAGALRGFGRSLGAWLMARDRLPVASLMDAVVRDTHYREFIDDGTDEGSDRWANVLELRSVAEEFSELGLTDFLEQVALVSDQDTLTDSLNAPTMLTVHAAKGLEFPVVFIVGLDEGVFPHQRSFPDREAMAEERRLFYVGITRAQDRLYLVRTFRRAQFGTSGVTEPSRFLEDIPADLLTGSSPGTQTREQASYARQTRWESRTPTPVEARYRAGMRVQHPRFGQGVVLETRLDRQDEEVTVVFENGETKHLMASLARLEVLEEGRG
jgi:DNA helicase-2/ATP-dependent DNA helicase PcrA